MVDDSFERELIAKYGLGDSKVSATGATSPVVGPRSSAVVISGRRLMLGGAVTFAGSFPVFLGVGSLMGHDASALASLTFLIVWFVVVCAAGVAVIVGWARSNSARSKSSSLGPQRPMTDTEADFRYRQAIAAQQQDRWRDFRDQVLAAEAERQRTRRYLTLSERDRYEEWITWQLGVDPHAESLPYPAPAYPPPETSPTE